MGQWRAAVCRARASNRGFGRRAGEGVRAVACRGVGARGSAAARGLTLLSVIERLEFAREAIDGFLLGTDLRHEVGRNTSDCKDGLLAAEDDERALMLRELFVQCGALFFYGEADASRHRYRH